MNQWWEMFPAADVFDDTMASGERRDARGQPRTEMDPQDKFEQVNRRAAADPRWSPALATPHPSG